MGTSVRLKVVPREGSPLRVGATVWRVDADGLPFSSAVASSITSSARPINLFAQVLTRHGHAPTFTATFLGPGLALAGARVPLTPSSAWDGCLHQVAPLRLELVLVDLAPRVALPEDVERDIMRTLIPALAHEPTDGQHDAHDH